MPEKYEESGCIAFLDEKTGETQGWIMAPNMNDASGRAYSEDISMEISKYEEESPAEASAAEDTGEAAETADGETTDGTEEAREEMSGDSAESEASGDTEESTEKTKSEEKAEDDASEYILEMTVSEEYLNSSERQYPVTVDPEIAWSGDSKLRDVYVISGSKYKSKNFYSSGTVVMPAGKGGSSYGTYRTYMKINGLESVVKGQSVASATLDVYGSGQSACSNNQKISIKKVTTDWNHKTLKWTKQPKFSSSALSTVTAGKTKKKKYTFNMTSYVQGVAKGEKNYGVVFVNTSSSPKYMSFFGSRKSTYKPKLKVVYYSVPSAPSEVKFLETASTTGDVNLRYAGIGSSGLKEVDYRLEELSGGTWKVYRGATKAGGTGRGTVAITGLPDGRYRAAVWGVNLANVKGAEKYSGELIVDKNPPALESIKIKTKDKEELGEAWTEDENPEIILEGINDNNVLTQDSISYALAEGNAAPVYRKCDSIKFDKESSGTYKASLRLSKEEQAVKSGAYKIHVKITDAAGGVVSKSVAYNKDNEAPKGSIKVFSNVNYLNEEIEELKGTVVIVASLDGTGSDLEKTIIQLLDDKGNAVEGGETGLCGEVDDSADFEFDSKKFRNGQYTLKANIKDQMGHEAEISKIIKIANPLDAPDLKLTYNDKHKAEIRWSYKDNEELIRRTKYKIGDGKWIDLEENTKYISPDTEEEGKYKITVMGVDKAGVATKAAACDFVVDKTAPKAKIEDVSRAQVTGKASDANLSEWKLLYREEGSSGDFKEAGLSGKEEIGTDKDKKSFGLIEYDKLGIEEGKRYELKLEVIDACGNLSSDTIIFERSENDTERIEEKAAFRIERPSYCRDYLSNLFTIPAETRTLKIRQGEENKSPDSINWYLENEKLSSEKEAKIDFSRYSDGEMRSILAMYKDGNSYKFSGDVIRNNEVHKIASEKGNEPDEEGNEPAETDQKTKLITAEENFVSFRAKAEENRKYRVRIGESTAEITGGERVYVADVTGGTMAYAGSIEIECLDENADISEDQLLLDSLKKESVKISSLACFIPDSISVKPRLNGRNYIYWVDKARAKEVKHEDISYNVYRSKTKDFTPSEENLAASGIKAGYYSEINLDEEDYYYAVTAVRTTDEKAEESDMSEIALGVNISSDETTKRLGIADYWKYTSFGTATGTAYIEESKGNLAYTEEDMAFDTDSLESGLSRTYNSNSKEKGAFGTGWTSSFDLQLLKVYGEDEEDNTNLIFRDGTGTIYRFVKDGDVYISSKGEYLTLKEEAKEEELKIKGQPLTVSSSYSMYTKDKLEYRFNSGGQLVYIVEPNGGFVCFEYQPDIGLLEKVTTKKGLSITFRYNSKNPEEDILLIKEAEMPDGSSREYKYKYLDDGSKIPLLESVTDHAAGSSEAITTSYEYSKGEAAKLNSISNEEGCKYAISYDNSGRVKEAALPEGEGYKFKYGTDGSGNPTTMTNVYADKGILSSEKTIATSKSTFEPNTGYCSTYIDPLGKKTEYKYVNGVCSQSAYEIESYRVDDAGNIVSAGVHKKTSTSEIGEKLEETKTLYEDGSCETYEYADTDKGLVEKDILRDSSGKVIESNEYKYNDQGEETYDYDAIWDRTTTYGYNNEGEIISMNEYKGKKAEGEEGTLISSTTYSISYGEGGAKTETETEKTDGVETVTVTEYDKLGRQISEKTSVAGEETISSNTYDGFGRLTGEVTKEDGTTTSTVYVYDKSGKLKTETTTIRADEPGTDDSDKQDVIETSYKYDKAGRETSVTETVNGVSNTYRTSYSYEDVSVFNGAGKKLYKNASVVRVKDDSDYIVSESYMSGSGLLLREKAEGVYTDYVYDDYGTNTAVYTAGANPENEKGYLSMSLIDSEGRVTDVIANPEKAGSGYKLGGGSVRSSSEYDAAGRVKTGTDPLGNKTSYSYDSKGELASVTLPGGEETKYTRSEAKEADKLLTTITTTDAKGRKSEQVTDESGKIIRVRDFCEDKDKEALYTEFTYDNKGRLAKEQEAAGNYKTYAYNKNGYVETERLYNSEGKQAARTSYEYNGKGDLKVRLDYEGEEDKEVLKESEFMSYDRQGRLSSSYTSHSKSLPDEEEIEKNKTSYEYDRKDNLTKVSYGHKDNGIKELKYSYDKDNRIEKIQDVSGIMPKTLREYSYDSYGRISRIEDAYNFKGIDEKIRREYSYDKLGRLKSVAHLDSKDDKVKENWNYEYNKNGNIIREEAASAYTGGEGLLEKIKEYTYDANGRLSKTVITEDGESVDLSGGEEANASATETEIHEYSYDAVGNRIRSTENGAVTDYRFNDLDQLISEETVNGGELVSNKTYLYDRNGNRTKESDSITKEVRSMTYNEIDMMTGCELKTGNEVNLIQKNTYNSQGQRIKKEERRTEEKQAFGDINSGDSTDSGDDSGEGSGDEGDDPDPDADDPDAGTASEGETEPEKELVKESREYFYQGASLLETRTEVAKEALTAGASETTEATGASNGTSGSTTGESGTESESFFNLLTPGGNIISAEVKKEGEEGNEEEGLYLYNRDEQGSTSSIINSEGRTAAVYDYDEYGNTEVLSGDSFGNELCYTGQVRDKSTGLYYYNARFYDSSVGSFTSQDSYRGEYNNPLTQNLYTYCAGDPVNRVDPTGHSWLSKWYKKLTKSSKKRETNKANRSKAKKAVKKERKAAAKTRRKAVKSLVRSVNNRINKIRGTKQQEIFTYNAYYASGSRLKTGKKASLNQMRKGMGKKPSAAEKAIYLLPLELIPIGEAGYGTASAVKIYRAPKVIKDAVRGTAKTKIYKGAKVTRGYTKAPHKAEPYSVYEKIDQKGRLLNRAQYGPNGRQMFREDYAQDHYIKQLKKDVIPHVHVYEYNRRGQRILKEEFKLIK